MSTAELSFPVTGMTCASCVRRVEKALTRVPGVTEAAVNLATERARVFYDPSAAQPEQLKAAVERAGYGVGELPPESPAATPEVPAVEATPGVPATEVAATVTAPAAAGPPSADF